MLNYEDAASLVYLVEEEKDIYIGVLVVLLPRHLFYYLGQPAR
jgi:hypothetical protein